MNLAFFQRKPAAAGDNVEARLLLSGLGFGVLLALDLIVLESPALAFLYSGLVAISCLIFVSAGVVEAVFATAALTTVMLIEPARMNDSWGAYLAAAALAWLIAGISRLVTRPDPGRNGAALFKDYDDIAAYAENDQGIVTYWNQGAESLFGCPAKDAVGRPTMAVLAGIVEHSENSEGYGHTHKITVRLRDHPSAGLAQCRTMSTALKDRRGNNKGKLTLCWKDVTTSQLRNWFQDVVRTMPQAAVLTDTSGHILLANAKADTMFGYTHGELKGLPVHMLVPERHRKRNARSHESSIIRPVTGKLGVPSSHTGLRKNGAEFSMEFWLSEIPFPGHIEVLYTLVDATERRRAEAWFELAVEASPTGMILVSSSGSILLINQQVERLFGYSKDELLDKKVELLVPEQFRPGHPALRDAYFARPEARAMGRGRDLFGLRKDGSEFPVEIGLNPLKTSAGVMVLCSVVDITQRKNAEQRLARRAEELARINAELDEFAYVASHDLQEPLLKVQAFGDLLADEYSPQLGAEGRDYIERMQNAAQRMKTLITDLLDYSRVARSKGRFAPTDMSQVLAEVINDLEIRVREINATIAPCALPVIDADTTQMRQLFQNIIGNALKYNHPGRPPVITISAKSKVADGLGLVPETLTINIRDNGIGFDQKYADDIFKPFRRLHGRTSYEGTGIGLAICKKIVERHGGTIEARGTPGDGAVFAITLPLRQEDRGAQQ